MRTDTKTQTPPVPGPERRTQSLAELAADQGVAGPQDFDALFGAGADLWEDDDDFETFLANLNGTELLSPGKNLFQVKSRKKPKTDASRFSRKAISIKLS